MSFVCAITLGGVALVIAVVAVCLRLGGKIQQLNRALLQQRQRLEQSLNRQQLLFVANPYPMWIYDRETLGFVAVNDAAVNCYGYSRDEFLSITLRDIRPEEDVPLFLEAVHRQPDGYSRAGTWRHRRKDGSLIFVRIMGFSFQEDGHPRRLVVALDLTERRQIEKALSDSQASLKQLVDDAPFGIAQSSLETNRLTTLNPAALEILGGYTLDEALALNPREHIYSDPKDRDRLLDILRRGGKINAWETVFKRKNGTLVPVRITGSLTGGKDGKVELFSTYIEDLTQQSALEQQVRQVQKLEAVGRLAGGMAHDFNNVLVVIKLSTEMMLSQVTPDNPFSKPLLQISKAADRAAALTKQMLAFGRQQIMQPRIINLNSVVSDTSHMLQRLIGEDIELVTNLAETVENSKLDPDQMTQVILNLAVNARDAMPAGGSLHIETSTVTLDEAYARDHAPVQPGRYVMLAVSDTGLGIERAILPRIFDPFFTTKEIGKGTGLGLSIVYGIVKQSGGYIWVYSEPGHGTTFKLYFPSTLALIDRAATRQEIVGRPSGQVVLVVDDEASIRSNIRDCLQQLGYQVLVAEGGDAASAVCEQMQGKIDLVVTDLVMSGMSGHDLGRKIAERYPEIRVLFMSGYTEDSASRREMLLTGSPFLQKPFSVAKLANAVQSALVLNMRVM